MATLQEYTCPFCGGVVEFDSTAQKPVCPYCDTEFDIEELKAAQKNETGDASKTEASPEINDEGLYVYICNSCGGEVVTDTTTAASHCPYCSNPIIMKGQFAGDLCPDLVIPFKLDKKAAKAAFMKHLTGKPLLPKVFKTENHIDEIKGLYVPFWLFDAHADGDFTYEATRVRRYETPNHRVTETKYYSVRRHGGLDFSAIPVDGSEKMANDLMESLEPFDLSDAVDFETAYLSGYLADRWDVESNEAIERAKQRITESTDDELRATVSGYNSVIKQSGTVNVTPRSSKYILLPVWILNTTWRQQKFVFAMNGQTGKFVGNLPIDKGAYFRHLIIGGLIASPIVFIILAIMSLL